MRSHEPKRFSHLLNPSPHDAATVDVLVLGPLKCFHHGQTVVVHLRDNDRIPIPPAQRRQNRLTKQIGIDTAIPDRHRAVRVHTQHPRDRRITMLQAHRSIVPDHIRVMILMIRRFPHRQRATLKQCNLLRRGALDRPLLARFNLKHADDVQIEHRVTRSDERLLRRRRILLMQLPDTVRQLTLLRLVPRLGAFWYRRPREEHRVEPVDPSLSLQPHLVKEVALTIRRTETDSTATQVDRRLDRGVRRLRVRQERPFVQNQQKQRITTSRIIVRRQRRDHRIVIERHTLGRFVQQLRTPKLHPLRHRTHRIPSLTQQFDRLTFCLRQHHHLAVRPTKRQPQTERSHQRRKPDLTGLQVDVTPKLDPIPDHLGLGRPQLERHLPLARELDMQIVLTERDKPVMQHLGRVIIQIGREIDTLNRREPHPPLDLLFDLSDRPGHLLLAGTLDLIRRQLPGGMSRRRNRGTLVRGRHQPACSDWDSDNFLWANSIVTASRFAAKA